MVSEDKTHKGDSVPMDVDTLFWLAVLTTTWLITDP